LLKLSWLASPGLILKAVLVALVSAVLVARSV
jgi:hypothetical protein